MSNSPTSVASSLTNLGNLYREQGKYADALPLYRRALEIGENAEGPQSFGVAATAANLAKLYAKEGKLDQAESMFNREIQVLEKKSEAEDSLVTALTNFADVYEKKGDVEKAKELRSRAEKIRSGWAKP